MRNADRYDYCLNILDPVTGVTLFHDFECVVSVEDWDHAAGTIDIHDVYVGGDVYESGARLLDGGEMAQMLRRYIISQAKEDQWLIDQVFSRNENDDPNGVWAKADAQRNEMMEV